MVCSAPVDARARSAPAGVRAVRTADGRTVEVGRAVVSGGHLARLAGMLEGVRAARRPGSRPGRVAARAQRVRRARGAARPTSRSGRPASPRPRPASAPPRAWPGTSTGTRTGRAGDRRPVAARGQPDRRRPRPGPRRWRTFKILTIAPYELADGRDWAEVKDEYAERLVDAGPEPVARARRRRRPGRAHRVAGRRRGAQPAQPRRLLPRRRVPARRSGGRRAGRATTPTSPACS